MKNTWIQLDNWIYVLQVRYATAMGILQEFSTGFTSVSRFENLRIGTRSIDTLSDVTSC
jgi:hypothetical protein